jgi:hypothetical protein
MKAAVDWMEQYRRHWEESFDRLEEYLKELQKTSPSTPEKPHGRRKKQP